MYIYTRIYIYIYILILIYMYIHFILYIVYPELCASAPSCVHPYRSIYIDIDIDIILRRSYPKSPQVTVFLIAAMCECLHQAKAYAGKDRPQLIQLLPGTLPCSGGGVYLHDLEIKVCFPGG